MRIAVCLFGLTGGNEGSHGKGKPLNLNDSYENYKKMIFNDHHFDFFTHSWSVDMEDKIIKTYNPKSIKIENPIDFSNIKLSDYKIQNHPSYDEIFRKLSKEDAIGLLKREIVATHSRWLSVKKSIQLMKSYKEKMRINYDFVLQLRYDLFFLKKITFSEIFLKKFLCIPRPFDNFESLHDLIFISSYEQAISFSSLFENILNYSIRSPYSSYEHLNNLNIKPFYILDSKDVMPIRDYLKLSKMDKIKIKLKSFLRS